MLLIIVLDSCGHETSGWLHLYKSDLKFDNTYQTLLEGKKVSNFHLYDAIICQLGHIYVLSSQCVKMIWEAHHSQIIGHFGVEKTMAVLQRYFYWLKLHQDVGKYIKSYTTNAITKPSIKKQGMYTP